jgi:hypothetical protein
LFSQSRLTNFADLRSYRTQADSKSKKGRRVNSFLGSLDRLCLVTKIWPFFSHYLTPCLFTSFFENMGRIYLEHFGGAKLFVCGQCDTFLTNRGELISSRFTGATGRAYLFGKVVNLNYRLVFWWNLLKNNVLFHVEIEGWSGA